MTDASYIDAAYAVFLIAVIGLSARSWQRHARARRRLAAIEAASPRPRRRVR